MKEPSREDKLNELYARMEAKREILNEEALRIYRETGKLTDPVLGELANEFEGLSNEYQCMLAGDADTWSAHEAEE